MDGEVQGEVSWSGEGVGTSAASFLYEVRERVQDAPAERAAVEVFRTLSDHLDGGLMEAMLQELPRDLRQFLMTAVPPKPRSAPARTATHDAIYHGLAERLGVEADQVRLILHGVFAALHGQLTDALSERIARELPKALSGTWDSARRVSNRPA